MTFTKQEIFFSLEITFDIFNVFDRLFFLAGEGRLAECVQ